MSRNQRHNSSTQVEEDEEDEVREIHTVPLSSASSDQFTTMSREFNAMVLAGATIPAGGEGGAETLDFSPSIVPDEPSSHRPIEEISLETVKREEVESKILSWQTAKVAKINSRFKREEVDISGWESEKVEKASAALKKAERELEEKRARALERMENQVAKAKQKAEEQRASAEAKRAAKVVRVLDMANLMRALGKAPARR